MFRSQMKYHPRIGYTYVPSARTRVLTDQGGYLVHTNRSGFRSEREFDVEKAPGTYRVLVFGDSQTAGDGVVNADRYSDLLEQALPGVEVYNYGLSGSGPDQQLLAYEEFANVEHDLVVIALYVENIRRVTRGIVKSLDSNGDDAYYAKPYYRLDDGELMLENVPVPKKGWTLEMLPAELRDQIYNYSETNYFSRDDRDRTPRYGLVARSRHLAPARRLVKNVAIRLSAFEPLPDYDSADSPSWLLLRRILEWWLAASERPVLLFPIPHHVYLAAADATFGYQARLAELSADTGCHLYDPLPALSKYSATERRSLWSDAAGHLSPRGHEVFAELLAPRISELKAATSSRPDEAPR